MYKKIDLFYDGKYLCSTNQYKTCKAAKLHLAGLVPDDSKLKAWFAK